jgi:hypothetical protein
LHPTVTEVLGTARERRKAKVLAEKCWTIKVECGASLWPENKSKGCIGDVRLEENDTSATARLAISSQYASGLVSFINSWRPTGGRLSIRLDLANERRFSGSALCALVFFLADPTVTPTRFITFEVVRFLCSIEMLGEDYYQDCESDDLPKRS